MFGLFTDAVENALGVGDSLLSGELPTKRQVAKLVDAGLSLYAASQLLGVGEDVLQKILEE